MNDLLPKTKGVPSSVLFKKVIRWLLDALIVICMWLVIYFIKIEFVIACYSFTHGENAIMPMNKYLTVTDVGDTFNAALIYVFVAWIYLAVSEIGKKRATMGMRLANLCVGDAHGQQITLSKATCRFLLNPSFWLGLSISLNLLSDGASSKVIPHLLENVYLFSEWLFYFSIVFIALQSFSVIVSPSNRSLSERLTSTIEYQV